MNAWRRAMPYLWSKWPVDDRAYDGKRYPLCWNVKMYKAVTFDMVLKRMCTPDFEYINEAEAITRIPNIQKLREEWEGGVPTPSDPLGQQGLSEIAYNDAIEEMRESMNGNDTMQFVTPERERRWGVQVPKEGLKCQYEFIGRSGGYLTLTHFMSLEIDSEGMFGTHDLYKLVDNWRLPYLYAMIDEITNAVNSRYDELIYKLAFYMRYNMPHVVPE